VNRTTLVTTRLVLRPFALDDATVVQRLAGAREVAATTLNIPHPYEDGMAAAWISKQAEAHAEGRESVFAIVRRAGTLLIGSIGLNIDRTHARAEMGYWIGVPYWNQGYCTEAAEAVLRHGFEDLGLHRIHASHFSANASSGRVMEKIGMRHEGRLRHHLCKWDEYHDLEVYGVLAAEWRERRSFV
jgi:RimJ/RimL family protein N-acetyltransferase